MFKEIFIYEFKYQVKQFWTWLFFATILILTFLMARDNSLAESLLQEFYLNSSFAVAKTTVFGNLIWLMLAAAVAGEASARDISSRMHPLVYTLPLKKIEYLGGRFLAAMALNAVLLLGIQVGILLALLLPGVPQDVLGPFKVEVFLTAYLYLSVPTAIAGTALQFFISLRQGKPMASYIGSFILFFFGFFIASVILYKQTFGAYIDPIGVRFLVEDIAHTWTNAEKNLRIIGMNGVILKNRLFWIISSIFLMVLTYLTFKFRHPTVNKWRPRFLRRDISEKTDYASPLYIPKLVEKYNYIINRSFNLKFHLQQLISITSTSFKVLAKSWVGFAFLVIVPLFSILILLDQLSNLGVPTTIMALRELTSPMTAELSRWVIVPPFIFYFAGELIWRERESNTSEIVDTLPGSEWTFYIGKLLGLLILLFLFLTLLVLTGILVQSIKGYNLYEIHLYIKVLLGFQFTEYALFAVLAMCIHTIANHKYLGHMIGLLIYAILALAPMFGLEHNMLIYGASPMWNYTEIRGFGHSLSPWLWFKGYWLIWAFILAVMTRLLWVTGKNNTHWKIRLKLLKSRFVSHTRLVGLMGLGILFLLSSFIIYNTHVLNKYNSSQDIILKKALYERSYKKYASAPQPAITHTTLYVDIFPKKQQATIYGTFQLVNNGSSIIDSIHFTTIPNILFNIENLNNNFEAKVLDDELGYHIYKLHKPMHPDDTVDMKFQITLKSQGFGNKGIQNPIYKNGTYINSTEIMPSIGYQPSREIIIAADRRAEGLDEKPVVPLLADYEPPTGRIGGSALKAIVSTIKGQTAVAPGRLINNWEEGGRSYFEYQTSAPIGGEYSVFSADYKVYNDIWINDYSDDDKAVHILLFYHPDHSSHLKKTIAAIKASLEYYTKEFGPYKYNHLSFVERPGSLGIGMHADASFITFGEGFGLWTESIKENEFDHPYAVVAHEMAHQWTVPYAFVEGAPVMSESIAWYYGMKAIEFSRGEAELHKLLSFMKNPYPYPPINRGEPLYRGLDPYLSYRKGPMTLYSLSKYIGEDKMNLALKDLLVKHQSTDSPPATTLDLYEAIKSVTPEELQPFLYDLFKVNTQWKFDIINADVTKKNDEQWEVSIELDAKKIRINEAGEKKHIEMDQYFPIALNSGNQDVPQLVTLVKLKNGIQTIKTQATNNISKVTVDPFGFGYSEGNKTIKIKE